MRPPDPPEDLAFPLHRSGATGEVIAEEGRGLVDLLALAEPGPETRELSAEFGHSLGRVAITLLVTATHLSL